MESCFLHVVIFLPSLVPTAEANLTCDDTLDELCINASFPVFSMHIFPLVSMKLQLEISYHVTH